MPSIDCFPLGDRGLWDAPPSNLLRIKPKTEISLSSGPAIRSRLNPHLPCYKVRVLFNSAIKVDNFGAELWNYFYDNNWEIIFFVNGLVKIVKTKINRVYLDPTRFLKYIMVKWNVTRTLINEKSWRSSLSRAS